MESRPELVHICKELEIDSKDMLIEDMNKAIREKIDELYNIKTILIGNTGKSGTLLYYMTQEYDYICKDKDGNLVDYKGRRLSE